MIYLVGFIGFIGGFLIGQMVLFFMLRHVKRKDLLDDPALKWKYGTLNWLIAGFMSYFLINLYSLYF